MASITRKTINNNPYYYVRESQRVNGKPKIVWQKYLGKVQDIMLAMENKNLHAITIPDEIIISQFGAVAAIYDIAKRWRIAEVIDSIVEKRKQGLSVGNYILIAAINRCLSPKSKNKIADWFWNTPLRRWIQVDKKNLSSQRFWDNMALLNAAEITEAEKKLTHHLIQEFNIDTNCLLYDTTNFITFIDTFNEENTLAKRGKGKQGGNKFRIVGLALLVSSDFHIPLFHETYAGNNPDCREFDSVVERLVERYKILSQTVENITLVFDKGNNSKNNFDKLASTAYHFVGSLKLNEVEDLLDIPLEQYNLMNSPRLQGVHTFRTKKNIFGLQRSIILTYNEELFLTQYQTILRETRKRTANLKALGITLSKWLTGVMRKGRKPTMQSVQTKVKEILKGQYMERLFKINITLQEKTHLPELSYSIDHQAMEKISGKRLGKTILFTDNHSWTDEQIILAYRGQHMIEKAFETMKNPYFVSWSPMWHWTDHNIRVHAFYCVLALAFASILQRELHQKGFEYSIPKAIDLLSNISEVLMVKHQPGKGKKVEAKPQIVISKMDDEQQKIFKALGLERYTEGKV